MRLSWRESVALVRGLVGACTAVGSQSSSGTYDEFALTEGGELVVDEAPSLSISELALLLTRLLPAADSRAADGRRDERPPAGLHFAIARALGFTQAPSFESVERFASVLARFEGSVPSTVLAPVVARYYVVGCSESSRAAGQDAHLRTAAATAAHDATPGVSGVSGEARGGTQVQPFVERRRAGVRSGTLRRLLRDEDRQNYLALAGRSNDRGVQRRIPRPAPDVLRLFLREADERNYALVRTVERMSQAQSATSSRHWRPRGHHLATVALLIVAGAIVGGRLHVAPAPSGPSASLVLPSPPSVAIGPSLPASTAANVERVFPVGEAVVERRTGGEEREILEAPPRPAVGAQPTVGRKAASGPAATAQRRPTRAGADRTAKRPGVSRAKPRALPASEGPALGNLADEPMSSLAIGPPEVPARRGPLPRFFAGVYRRLGSLVRTPPSGMTE